MKKCLIVVANPSTTGFGFSMAKQFQDGLVSEGHTFESINLFQDNFMDDDGTLVAKYKEQILNCDAMCFVFPWWFEMPPFPLVKFFQSIFVEGFAYTHDGEVKTPKIKLPVQVLITMGQRKEYNIRSLRDGMDYVGLRIERELVCTNVGPRLEPELSERYLESALRCGKMFF